MQIRIGVVVASAGRPAELGQWRERIAAQPRAPDAVVYSVPDEGDLPAVDARVPGARIAIGARGLTRQRNAGIEALAGAVDVIAFFDDDYLPSIRAVEGLARLFTDRPDLASAGGTLLADGIHGPGIPHGEAMAALAAWDATPPHSYATRPHGTGLYGCNMAYRASAIGATRFDERLPLYGWQEDIDFGARLERPGPTVITDAFVGVHQGVKRGRTSGVRLGYSQIANPAYMARKGSMTGLYALRLIVANVLANHARALRPEPWVDRAGRARGNRMALADLARGRADPERILEIG